MVCLQLLKVLNTIQRWQKRNRADIVKHRHKAQLPIHSLNIRNSSAKDWPMIEPQIPRLDTIDFGKSGQLRTICAATLQLRRILGEQPPPMSRNRSQLTIQSFLARHACIDIAKTYPVSTEGEAALSDPGQ